MANSKPENKAAGKNATKGAEDRSKVGTAKSGGGRGVGGSSRPGGGKANAPGQQAPGSTQPAPGKSGALGRGQADAARIQRTEQRNIDKALGDASDGGGELQAPDGRPSTDGTLAGADTLERQQNGGLTNAEKAADELAGTVDVGGGVTTDERGQREVDPTTGEPPKL